MTNGSQLSLWRFLLVCVALVAMPLQLVQGMQGKDPDLDQCTHGQNSATKCQAVQNSPQHARKSTA